MYPLTSCLPSSRTVRLPPVSWCTTYVPCTVFLAFERPSIRIWTKNQLNLIFGKSSKLPRTLGSKKISLCHVTLTPWFSHFFCYAGFFILFVQCFPYFTSEIFLWLRPNNFHGKKNLLDFTLTLEFIGRQTKLDTQIRTRTSRVETADDIIQRLYTLWPLNWQWMYKGAILFF